VARTVTLCNPGVTLAVVSAAPVTQQDRRLSRPRSRLGTNQNISCSNASNLKVRTRFLVPDDLSDRAERSLVGRVSVRSGRSLVGRENAKTLEGSHKLTMQVMNGQLLDFVECLRGQLSCTQYTALVLLLPSMSRRKLATRQDGFNSRPLCPFSET